MHKVTNLRLQLQRWPEQGRSILKVVCFSKGADAITTVTGLLFLPLVEANPAAGWLIIQLGLFGGIIVGSVLSIGIVVAITELAVIYSRSLAGEDEISRSIRLLGYGGASTVWLLVALHNFVLIVTTI